MKKAQVSIFIIIAIVLIVVIAVIFFIKSPKTVTNNIDPDALPAYNYYKDCIKDAGYNALEKIGLTGGGVVGNLTTEGNVIYYLYLGNKNIPTIPEIEKQTNNLMDYFIGMCKYNSSTEKIESSPDSIKSNTTILDDKVVFNVEYPITITKDGKSFGIKNFNDIEVNIRLGLILKVADELSGELNKNPESLCLSCIDNISKKYNMFISVHDIDSNNSLIIIADPQSKINERDFALVFAIKYKKA